MLASLMDKKKVESVELFRASSEALFFRGIIVADLLRPDLRRDAVEPSQCGYTRTVLLSTTLASLRGVFFMVTNRAY
jgi:hypothetical protein